MESQLEFSLLVFYGWWQFAVCLFAFVALMAIWHHIGRRQGDLGQVWLALSILCWSISGIMEVYFANTVVQSRVLSDEATFVQGYRSIFSLLNSLLILLALPWFRYIPTRIEAIVKSNYWKYIVGIPFVFLLIPAISRIISGRDFVVIIELDVYYSFFTLGFLGLVLFESFIKRRLTILAYLSIVCILITFIAEILKLTGSNLNMLLMSAIFKTSLIMIFFALAMSWVKELSEHIIPESKELFLQFLRSKNENQKIEHKIAIYGIPGKNNQIIKLTPASYNLLYTFAEKRKEGPENWLDIKPKQDNRSGKIYHIKDHNEIKRLMHSLLNGLFGKQMWTKEHHELPLRKCFFEMSEKRERKIRLRIPAANITLEENLS